MISRILNGIPKGYPILPFQLPKVSFCSQKAPDNPEDPDSQKENLSSIVGSRRHIKECYSLAWLSTIGTFAISYAYSSSTYLSSIMVPLAMAAIYPSYKLFKYLAK